MDVSSYQRTANWRYWRATGKRFAYIKATEGISYRNRYFGSQYRGSRDAGMLRGAYHFATPGDPAVGPKPTTSSGTAAGGPATAGRCRACSTSSPTRTASPAMA